MNSADAIARVVTDLRTGQYRHVLADNPLLDAICNGMAQLAATTTVDSTLVYDPMLANPRDVMLYEDHPSCAPPWDHAAVCYVNRHGNVIVMATSARDIPVPERKVAWETPNEIDWARVRWLIDVPVFMGGHDGKGNHVRTLGPVHMWQLGVYESGELADLHWVHLMPEHSMELWDMALLVLLGTLNFMGCRNVELRDAVRTEKLKQRRGYSPVSVKTLAVRLLGRSTRSTSEPGDGFVPLTSVRGHAAHYGACCTHHEPRGLLFGRLTGRYWIPQHARGNPDAGEHQPDYKIVP